MFTIMTARQKQSDSSNKTKRKNRESIKMRKMTGLKMMTMLMMIMMTMLLLNTTTVRSNLAESETNDLNTLETPKRIVDNAAIVSAEQSKVETRQYPYTGFMATPSSFASCPLCDSSVYSYCSHKLIHDSCCCDFPGSSVYQKPPQCVYYDCSLLYAKTCYEHALIKNCCCNNPF